MRIRIINDTKLRKSNGKLLRARFTMQVGSKYSDEIIVDTFIENVLFTHHRDIIDANMDREAKELTMKLRDK